MPVRVENPKVGAAPLGPEVSRAPWLGFSGIGPDVPDIEQAAAMAVHMHGYGDQRFRQV